MKATHYCPECGEWYEARPVDCRNPNLWGVMLYTERDTFLQYADGTNGIEGWVEASPRPLCPMDATELKPLLIE